MGRQQVTIADSFWRLPPEMSSSLSDCLIRALFFMPSLSTLNSLDANATPTQQAGDPSSSAATEPNLSPLERLAERIRQAHRQCQAAIDFGLLQAHDAGACLVRAQAQLPPDRWSVWLAESCQISENTAQTYIAIARGWPGLEQAPSLPPGRSPASQKPDGSGDEKKGDLHSPTAIMAEPVLKPVDPSDRSQPFDAKDPVAPPTSAKPTPVKRSDRPKASEVFSFWIPGRVSPKARPRVTANGTYLPKPYRQWRLRAEGEILMQLQQMHPQPQLPIQQAAVQVVLHGKHRGDGDNLAGSILDSLVGAGVLPSDSLKHLPYGCWRHVPDSQTGVQIDIKPLPPSR
ncbi:MAG: RusA family crossover junction endodeoxyribonuclease [Cyanobacteria bacterium J007]|nr:MAG: RusA family crossover junction endodeoxyribonuclease [Cyanobacteria bacterium J007]